MKKLFLTGILLALCAACLCLATACGNDGGAETHTIDFTFNGEKVTDTAEIYFSYEGAGSSHCTQAEAKDGKGITIEVYLMDYYDANTLKLFEGERELSAFALDGGYAVEQVAANARKAGEITLDAVSADRTLDLLRQELLIQKQEQEEALFYASLEKIFIEERIYKDAEFENAKDMDEAVAHIDSRLEPFKPSFIREVTRDDILRLMEIKMGRILKFNSDKSNEFIAQTKREIERINHHLEFIVDYTVDWFTGLKEKYGKNYPRLTEIRNFDTIEATKVVEANEKLYINRQEGFIGYGLKKDEYVCNCSDIDDVIIFYRNGTYKIVRIAEKMFVGKDILYVNVFKRNDVRTIYNVIYRDGKVGYNYIKRFAVTGITRDKEYDLTKGTEGSRILYFSANPNGEAETVKVILKPKARQKLLVFEKNFSDIAIKGRGSQGNILTKADIHKISLKQRGSSTLGGLQVWFDRDILRLNYDGRGEELGEFHSDDQILVVLNNGDFYTTNFDLSNHYEQNILVIEKYRPGKTWTAIVYDADQKYY